MKLDIDLDDMPQGDGPLTPNGSPSGPTVTFHYDEPIKLPKYGRLVIEYELQHESVNKRKGEKPDYACTVEICHLISVKEIKESDDEVGDVPKASNSAKETEEALDSHAAAYEKE